MSTHEPIQERIRRTGARLPDRTAVDQAGGPVSYRRLLRRAADLAAALAAAGVAPGSLVGVLSSASAEVIAAMLGILEAGCAYVPVDPDFQVARLESVAAVASPAAWLVDPRHAAAVAAHLRASGAEAAVIPLAPDWLTAAEGSAPVAPPDGRGLLGPDDRAYVYFTSGSTGRPKGIEGRLKGIDHYILWMVESFGVTEGTRFGQLISPGWDGFMVDAFVPLAAGGTICVPDGRETVLDGTRLHAWLDRERVEMIHCTPSLFRSLLNQDLKAEHFPALRCVFLVGEALLQADVRRWYEVFGERVRLVNLYGPTETTLTKLFHPVTPADLEAASIPIGRPMPGARAIVVDGEGNPCAPGELGEIYIRTPYRALGYLNEPELTAQVFIPNPFSDRPDDIVYRTGDLGRLREDGELEFAGRRDGQVKIRGIRIEMAPIEDALRSHPVVADVVVVGLDDIQGNKFLCAYVVLRGEAGVADLREHLRARLAELMVPSAFVALPALPRTPTGKVDRRALPDPGQAAGQARLTGEPVPPRTPMEEELCAIFAGLLDLPRVGIRDDFFAIGGHSLLTTLLLSRIRTAFGVEVPLRRVFEIPTVEGLALEITALQAAEEEDFEEMLREIEEEGRHAG